MTSVGVNDIQNRFTYTSTELECPLEIEISFKAKIIHTVHKMRKSEVQNIQKVMVRKL